MPMDMNGNRKHQASQFMAAGARKSRHCPKFVEQLILGSLRNEDGNGNENVI